AYDFLFNCACVTLVRHSFPTRRSSDLPHQRGSTAQRPTRRRALGRRKRPRGGPHSTQRRNGGADVRRAVFGGNTRTGGQGHSPGDRKSTRLNSSHVKISYAVFCLKKTK